MKILYFALVALLAAGYSSFAQNTFPFPQSGNVGIGTTSPTSWLQITGTSGSNPGGIAAPTTSVLKLSRWGTPDYSYPESAEFRIGHGGPSVWGSKLDLFLNGGSNTSDVPDQQVMTWLYNGNVGIGTANPINKLHIKMDNDFSIIQRSASTSYAGHYYVTGPDNAINFNFFTGLRENSDDYHILNGEQGVDAVTINHSTNFVGINTTNPTSLLQLGDFNAGAQTNQIVIPGNYNFEQMRLGQIGNGNMAMEFVNHMSTAPSYGIKFLVDVDSAPGLQLQYAPQTTSYSGLTYTTGLYMNLSGNVGIGTVTPDTKLAVNGTIHSKQVVVDLTGWSDYVFKPTYTLPPLSEVKTYIDKNQHLPDMPSADQVEKDGLNLGEMNKLLTKKVEELTLYLIEKDSKDKEKETQLKEQQENIKQLQSINQSLQEKLVAQAEQQKRMEIQLDELANKIKDK